MAVPPVILQKTYAPGTDVTVSVYWDQSFTDTQDHVVTPPGFIIDFTVNGGTLQFPGVPSTAYAYQDPDQAPRIISVHEDFRDGTPITRGYFTPVPDDPTVPIDIGTLTVAYTNPGQSVVTTVDHDEWLLLSIIRGLLLSRHKLSPAASNQGNQSNWFAHDAAGHIIASGFIDYATTAALTTVQQSVQTNNAVLLALVNSLIAPNVGTITQLSQRVTDEIARALAAEGVLTTSVTTERNRALAIEAGLRTDVDTLQTEIETAVPELAGSYTTTYTANGEHIEYASGQTVDITYTDNVTVAVYGAPLNKTITTTETDDGVTVEVVED